MHSPYDIIKIMKQTKPRSSAKNKTSPSKRSFFSRHKVWSVILIAILIIATATLALLVMSKTSIEIERQNFRQIKEDMLTLQKRLEVADGNWEYYEACSHSGGGFNTNFRFCSLGIKQDYPVNDQNDVDTIIQGIAPLLTQASKGLFKPEEGSYSASSPQFAMATIAEARGESVASKGGDIDSIRWVHPISCSYGYNLTTVLADQSKKLSVGLSCSSHVLRTYFDDPYLKPDHFRHKAEYPL